MTGARGARTPTGATDAVNCAQPGRVDSLVLSWCASYTRGLPEPVASARYDELRSDLYDHRAASLSAGSNTIAREVFVRALLGVPADLSWRIHQLRIARSARRQEAPMNVRPAPDRWTAAAYALGAVVTLWSLFLFVGMLVDLPKAAAGSEDHTWRLWLAVVGALATALSVHGLVSIRTTHATRAGVEFAVAAVISTFWMMWVPPILVAGALSAVFFGMYAARGRRRTALPERTLTA